MEGKHTHWIGAVASAAALVLLASCGGGGGGTSSNGAGTTTTGSGSSSSGGSTNATPTLAAATQVVDGTALGATQWSDASPTSTGQQVSGLNCTVAGNTYSYSHLSIYQNGKQLALPANIGTVAPTNALETGCVYPVHTDDNTGKIRMDVTSNTTYTLGQFFAVWGQPLSSTNVAGITGTVTAWVNTGGALQQYTGDLASLVLPQHGEVTLAIGTPPAQIPTYTWIDPPPFDTAHPTTLVYGGVVGTTAAWPTGGSATGATIDGVTCASGMAETFHVHSHVAIFKDGQWLQFPQQIGLPGTCNYEMHTHDQTGIIHIETPTAKTYTLGQFFDIWGQPLTTTNVAGITGNVVVYINDNGDSRRYLGDPRDIVLTSHRDITFQIGSPVSSLATYSWYEPQ
ncbi:hypothetical protein P9239_00670 [Caballeronia sp. LZ062]|uniref:hypothetical protein n=1 Tax=unclassified Caballeronia TaxID=2646786 RepID=UPI00285BEEAC|nr:MULTISPECIES: hypothetical protein [unclassified Caballeronia]MDR5857319.1 hypothetical protein [Caballeronia sp. LZ050]MDR5868870.1 hypothetical protein [Caballeronia sp. LZ062]